MKSGLFLAAVLMFVGLISVAAVAETTDPHELSGEVSERTREDLSAVPQDAQGAPAIKPAEIHDQLTIQNMEMVQVTDVLPPLAE